MQTHVVISHLNQPLPIAQIDFGVVRGACASMLYVVEKGEFTP